MKDLTHKECLDLLTRNYIGRISFISKGNPEIIPITYYYNPEKNSIISYSGEGSKITAMRKNNSVSFQVDEISDLDKWKSVLVYGKYEELSGIDAKHVLRLFSEGVKNLLQKKEKNNANFISEFSSKIDSEGTPVVYRINISNITGRQRV
ncbi:pyridoxamine 5'-phosphate oxidase family protein [Christiangramia sediminis]|uniref:Pyridoxamine 5'-phosphate oxidase family protein n=1 Tax=Christiangramia sediminis TaxID=2881336 RepID=A0A9X1RWW0_9FLAO|nr:pyridoxamine 5'-phosphate oxidase family protein [Christiangramia sediminis]MCB7481026.1 pyridoxamine 5'-phosphate oxidase family protein [Christiangramia sediminis]